MNSTDQLKASFAPPLDDLAPVFKPFEWVPERRQRGPYDMLSDVRDIAAGIGLVLQIVERSEMQKEVGDAPILDNSDIGQLLRLSIASMHTVEGRIDTYFEHLNNPNMPVTETERGGK